MKITSAYLIGLGACDDHLDRFVRAFPDGLDVTGEPTSEIVDAVRIACLDLDWFVSSLPSADAHAAYKLATYEAGIAYHSAWLRARDTYGPLDSRRYRAIQAADIEQHRAEIRALWCIVAGLPKLDTKAEE